MAGQETSKLKQLLGAAKQEDCTFALAPAPKGQKEPVFIVDKNKSAAALKTLAKKAGGGGKIVAGSLRADDNALNFTCLEGKPTQSLAREVRQFISKENLGAFLPVFLDGEGQPMLAEEEEQGQDAPQIASHRQPVEEPKAAPQIAAHRQPVDEETPAPQIASHRQAAEEVKADPKAEADARAMKAMLKTYAKIEGRLAAVEADYPERRDAIAKAQQAYFAAAEAGAPNPDQARDALTDLAGLIRPAKAPPAAQDNKELAQVRARFQAASADIKQALGADPARRDELAKLLQAYSKAARSDQAVPKAAAAALDAVLAAVERPAPQNQPPDQDGPEIKTSRATERFIKVNQAWRRTSDKALEDYGELRKAIVDECTGLALPGLPRLVTALDGLERKLAELDKGLNDRLLRGAELLDQVGQRELSTEIAALAGEIRADLAGDRVFKNLDKNPFHPVTCNASLTAMLSKVEKAMA